MSKYNVGLKTVLLQGLSEPEFYGDLVYKFRKIIGKNDFPYHFKKIVVRYKKIGYNINVMRQTDFWPVYSGERFRASGPSCFTAYCVFIFTAYCTCITAYCLFCYCLLAFSFVFLLLLTAGSFFFFFFFYYLFISSHLHAFIFSNFFMFMFS